MTKGLLKLAICGVIAAASSMAFANTASLQALQSAEVRNIVGQTLGLSAGATEAQILSKINSLSAAQSAAVTNAITILNNGLKVGGKSAAEVSKNKQANLALAKSIFTQNGQAVTLATISQKYALRANTDKAVGASCSLDEAATKLSAGTRVSFADAQAALKSGLVIKGCSAGSEGILNMAPQAREVAARTVLTSKAKGVSLEEAMAEVKGEVLNVKTTAAAERANVAKLKGADCQVFAN